LTDFCFWLRTGWQPGWFWKGLVLAQHWILQSEKMLLFRVSSTSKIPFFGACNQVNPLNSSETLKGGNCHIHYSLDAPRGPEQGSWHLAGLLLHEVGFMLRGVMEHTLCRFFFWLYEQKQWYFFRLSDIASLTIVSHPKRDLALNDDRYLEPV